MTQLEILQQLTIRFTISIKHPLPDNKGEKTQCHLQIKSGHFLTNL